MYKKIKELMESRGETLMQLSRNANVPYTTLKNLESGDKNRNLSIKNAKLIADYFGVTIDELCEEVGE